MFDDRNTHEGSLIGCIRFLHFFFCVFFFPSRCPLVAACGPAGQSGVSLSTLLSPQTRFFRLRLGRVGEETTRKLRYKWDFTTTATTKKKEKICKKGREIKTCFDVDKHGVDGVLVRTHETFCSDWPAAGRSCPFFRAACIRFLFFPPRGGEGKKFLKTKTKNSDQLTVALASYSDHRPNLPLFLKQCSATLAFPPCWRSSMDARRIVTGQRFDVWEVRSSSFLHRVEMKKTTPPVRKPEDIPCSVSLA